MSVQLDRTTTIRASVQDVEFTLALTIVLVVLVILLFLRNFWATFIPGVTVPLALLGSFAMMYLLNFSLDNLSLMALTIAVGFVVDDAIVVVENIHRHIENGEPPFEAAVNGSREIGFTVLSISFSLIAVFIPLLLMGGIIGRLFREFAMTVTASIAVSALVSLTLAPMLCSRFMRHDSHSPGAIYRAIEGGFDAMLTFYQRTLDIVLRHQPITLAVFFATMALTGAMLYYTPKGFFPIQDIGLINGISEGSQDISPQEMMRLTNELGEVVMRDPAVAGLRLDGGLDQRRQDREHRQLHHRAQAARGTRRYGRRADRPVAAATRQGHRRQSFPPARAGHHGGRPHRARRLPVHGAGSQHRRD